MICLTGGGTGGHLATVHTLGAAIAAAGARAIFLGTSHGLDRAWLDRVRANGPQHVPGALDLEAAYFLPTRGVMGHRGAARIAAGAGIVCATARAYALLRRHRVQAVLSVGAYAAAPASFAAVLAGIPLFLHEHNARPGRLHRLLASRARAVYSSFLPESPVRDYPIDEACFALARIRDVVRHVLFLGGSHGARGINDFALRVAPYLRTRGIAISHQTGSSDQARVAQAYRTLGIEVDCFGFDPKLRQRMARADLAVSRAGGTTLWELAALGLPALLVPFPHAVDDHQHANALHFAARGLAWIAREKELQQAHLERILDADLASISEALMASIAPGGAAAIAAHFLGALAHRGQDPTP